jgi:TRAP transporter TAXI family solute receptor
MIEKYPGLIKIQLPGGIYRGRPEPLDTFGTPCVFATRKDLPTDVIYEVTKAFWENYKRSWKLNPNFKDYIRPENALSGLAIPLHPGAYKYYKEAGYNIPKKLLPID